MDDCWDCFSTPILPSNEDWLLWNVVDDEDNRCLAGQRGVVCQDGVHCNVHSRVEIVLKQDS